MLLKEESLRSYQKFEKSHDNVLILQHHWRSSEESAKLFATYNPNTQERQTENEIIFSSVDKVLNSSINYRKRHSIISEDKRLPPEHCLYGEFITYPVIILNDFTKLYETTITEPEKIKQLKREPSFEIEVNYEYIHHEAGMRWNVPEYFLVDVVNFNKLEDYLTLLREKDLQAVLSLL